MSYIPDAGLYAGADPHRFPSFYGNWSDFKELVRDT